MLDLVHLLSGLFIPRPQASSNSQLVNGHMLRFFVSPEDSLAISHFIRANTDSELDWEAAYITPDVLAKFPGTIFVCEQGLGDLVLVPGRSCHQVVNKGGLSIKTSWSRVITKGAVEAVREECPIYRRQDYAVLAAVAD